jgi:hypothetical protein
MGDHQHVDPPASVSYEVSNDFGQAVVDAISICQGDRYETSSRGCWVKVEYDPRQLNQGQIIEILDGALANAEHPERPCQDNRIARRRARG